MSDSDDVPRRFDDREVGQILKRATELQGAVPEPSGKGLSMEELEDIALEAGIDPGHLRQAAAEIEARAPTGGLGTAVLGTSPTVSVDRVLRGEIDDDGFEPLLSEIQRMDTGLGVPSVLGRTLTWRSSTPANMRTLQVTVSSRDGWTRIHVEEQLHDFAGGLFGGLIGGGGCGLGVGVGLGVGLGVLESVVFSVAFPLGMIGATYLAARGIFRRTVARRRVVLLGLMERMCAIVERQASTTPTLGQTGAAPALPPGEAP